MFNLMPRKAWIFDLDGTVICSKHRQLTKPDGSLDLEHWRENCTPEKIAGDSLLPLADLMKGAMHTGGLVAICTSRVMTESDWKFLHNHGLRFHLSMFRAPYDTRADGEYKRDKLTRFMRLFPHIPAHRICLYDDNDSVLEVSRSLGITTRDAKIENAELSRELKTG